MTVLSKGCAPYVLETNSRARPPGTDRRRAAVIYLPLSVVLRKTDLWDPNCEAVGGVVVGLVSDTVEVGGKDALKDVGSIVGYLWGAGKFTSSRAAMLSLSCRSVER